MRLGRIDLTLSKPLAYGLSLEIDADPGLSFGFTSHLDRGFHIRQAASSEDRQE